MIAQHVFLELVVKLLTLVLVMMDIIKKAKIMNVLTVITQFVQNVVVVQQIVL